ncbi:MAG: hypothetical protein NWF06_07040 [Candidatus Bathyarchaeota archaeon]|nr:hypothetical protein [Candidatus Bathyarchaeum sp.]
MKKVAVIAVLLVLSLLLVVVFSFLSSPSSEQEPFYVGVTYCGESVEEAKLLVDKVKDYTNVFFLQSGELQKSPDNVTEIGDYVVSCGLQFVVYFGTDSTWLMKMWQDTYDGHWGDQFGGIYFGDEHAGKMLDGEMFVYEQETQSSVRKMADGTITGYKMDANTSVTYKQDGTVMTRPVNAPVNSSYVTTYYVNGTVTVMTEETGSVHTVEEGSVDAPYTYEELWSVRPFQSYDETAERFIDECSFELNRYGPSDFSYFTSDYALFWFDYKSGYDTVLAQVGWNQTVAKDVALVRGAAELQNKTWGVIITWKYNNPPYLDSGEAIYEQMVMAYENGAQYVVIFNYAPDMQGPYGTLQEEHFVALEQFWNEVVQSSQVRHGSVKADAVLVLPENYGWGMRHIDDKIWGLWAADENSQQIWDLSCSLLEQYGTGLDIVYDDPQFPVEGKYSHVYYWNQTG